MTISGSQRRTKAPFVATFIFAVALGGVAAAQTVIQTAPPDPMVTSLRDQVNDLETQVRKLTGDNEKLQFDLARAREENVRLNKAVDDMNAQAAAAAAAPPPASGKLGDIPASAAANASGDAAGDYKAAYDLIAKGDSKGAEEGFTAFLAAYPSDAKAPDAHYWLGQSLLAQGRAPDAAAHFLNVIQKTPKAAIAPQAMVRLGVSLNRMGQKAQACSTLKAVPTQYPKASAEIRNSAAANIKSIGC